MMEGNRFGLFQTTSRFCSQNLTRPNNEAAGGSGDWPKRSAVLYANYLRNS